LFDYSGHLWSLFFYKILYCWVCFCI
jgi:hypothetical protein